MQNILVILLISFAASCASSEQDNQTNNHNNGDEPIDTPNSHTTPEQEYVYGEATIRSVQVMVMESFPVQVRLQLEGDLGDGCTSLYEIEKEMIADTFHITVTTQRPKGAICTQQLASFKETTDLEVRGLRKGTYYVKAGKLISSFKLEADNEMK